MQAAQVEGDTMEEAWDRVAAAAEAALVAPDGRPPVSRAILLAWLDAALPQAWQEVREASPRHSAVAPTFTPLNPRRTHADPIHRRHSSGARPEARALHGLEEGQLPTTIFAGVLNGLAECEAILAALPQQETPPPLTQHVPEWAP